MNLSRGDCETIKKKKKRILQGDGAGGEKEEWER